MSVELLNIIVQFGFFFDFIPRWLGPTAIFFGAELILLGVARQTFSRNFPFWSRLNPREAMALTGGFGLGVLLTASAVLRQFNTLWLYAMLLFCLGQVISGAAAVRLYKKLLYLSREHEWPGQWQTKVKKMLLRIFLVIIAGWLLFLVLTGTSLYGGFAESLQFIWTFLIFSTSALGIAFKLDYARGVLNYRLRIGFILCVAGASVFNIAPFLRDLLVLIAGTVAYSIGFWFAAVLLIRSEAIRDPEQARTA